MFGVMVIIVGLSAMNGFERELNNRVLAIIPHGEFEAVQPPLEKWKVLSEQVETSPSVLAAAPYIRVTGLVEFSGQLKAVSFRGIDKALESKVSSLYQYIDANAWTSFEPGQQQTILGKGIAEKLGVHVGDWVTMILPKESQSKKLSSPQRIRVQVIGLLNLDGQIDHSLVLLPLSDMQQYLSMQEGVSGVAIKVSQPLSAAAIVRSLGNQITSYVYLKSWQQQFGYLYRDIQMVKTILYLVMVLVIGVACFNIVSTLMMVVKERGKEIAILKTMGAGRQTIRRIFIYQGLLTGVMGSALGVLAGCLLSLNLTKIIALIESVTGHHFLSGDIYFVDFLPSQIAWLDVVIVAVTAVVVAASAALYPAHRAAKLMPARLLAGN
jgi:lipoprotein-releasing system permease protein